MHLSFAAVRLLRTALVLLAVHGILRANDIQWLSFNFPDSAMGGTTLTVSATVTNTGAETWGGAHNLVMRDASGTPVAMESLDGIEPGQSTTVNLSYGLPDVTTELTFSFQALEHQVEYFGPTYSGTVSVTQQPRYEGMQLSTTTFDALAPARISTSDTWVTYHPGYRLRAKVIDGTFWGWHAANLWNTNGAPLDNPPPAGAYALCELYWVLYDRLYGNVQLVGPSRRVSLAVTGSVTLSSNWFHASNPPTIDTNEDLSGGTYRLFATFADGRGGSWETSGGYDNKQTRLTNLPPPGSYAVSLFWRKYDAAMNVIGASPVRSATVQITGGPILVLARGGTINGNEVLNEEDGTTTLEFDRQRFPVEVTTAGVLRAVASAQDGGQIFLNAYSGDGQHLQSGIPELAVPVARGTYWVEVTADRAITYFVSGELYPYATVPVITSPDVAAGLVGATFAGYTVVATGTAPIAFGAPSPGVVNGLPPGLTINPATGVIAGTPTTAGTYAVRVTASNGAGAVSKVVTFTVTASAGGGGGGGGASGGGGAGAPVVVTHPQSRTVALGASVTLAVSATGTGPLAYQWRKNGANLPGATGATLTFAAFQASDAGRYEAVVTNAAGSATSNAAALTAAAINLRIHRPQ